MQSLQPIPRPVVLQMSRSPIGSANPTGPKNSARR